jgi:hypothetical protein
MLRIGERSPATTTGHAHFRSDFNGHATRRDVAEGSHHHRRGSLRRIGVTALSVAVVLLISAIAGLGKSAPGIAVQALSVPASEDTFVKSSRPAANYGQASTLEADTLPSIKRALVRFTVSGVPKTASVSSATLRIYVAGRSRLPGEVRMVSGSWSEARTTWSNAPAVRNLIAKFPGTAATGTWKEADVTAGVAGNGTFSFYIVTTSDDGVDYNSTEAPTNWPTLVVQWSQPAASQSPTPVATRTPTPITTSAPAPTAPRATATPAPAPSTPPGRAYYVDSVNGNDAWSGSLPEANASRTDGPWKSISRANSKLGPNGDASPGDSVRLKRGSVWSGATLTVTRGGTAAGPITVEPYGTGAMPPTLTGANTCLDVSGSFIVVAGITTDACFAAGQAGNRGVAVSGSNIVLRDGVASHNLQGMYLKGSSSYVEVTNYAFLDNTGYDGTGSSAIGIQVRGSHHNIHHNRLERNYWTTADGCRGGDAVEVYAASGETTAENSIHHNTAIDNQTFSEMGRKNGSNPGIVRDNTYYYNLVRASLPAATCSNNPCKGTSFLVTRGEGDTTYGPVERTSFYNNTGNFTGSCSQGIVCSGCTSSATWILRLRNNISVAAAKGAYFGGSRADEDYNLFRHTGSSGADVQCNFAPCSTGAHTITGQDPRFVGPVSGDLRVQLGSPAIDAGIDLGFTSDLGGMAVPRDGNGDGIARPDFGALEGG